MGERVLYSRQLVLVGEEVPSSDTGVVTLDVEEAPGDGRHGFVWIGDRQAVVFQRYPGRTRFMGEYEWVFSHWTDVV
jgi:hypothetical protein